MRLYITKIMNNFIMETMGKSQPRRETVHVNIAMNYKSAQHTLFIMSFGKSITVYRICRWVYLDTITFHAL